MHWNVCKVWVRVSPKLEYVHKTEPAKYKSLLQLDIAILQFIFSVKLTDGRTETGICTNTEN
jgi:hypothetical protein